MAAPIIFQGNVAKTLTAGLKLAENASFFSGTANPTSVATAGTIGDLYVRTTTPAIYQKITTSATDTNWQEIGAGGTIPTVQKFLSGTGTYSLPNGVTYIKVEMIGGGGGGGGGIATLGTAGVGGTGGTTSFGTSLLTCTGGIGGSNEANGAPNTGGAGGTASLGTGPYGIALTGGSGAGGPAVSGIGGPSGSGAASAFGGAGMSVFNGNTGINAADNTGAGASGGTSSNGTGSAGSGGGAGGYIHSIIANPSATYPYVVGSGGAGGTSSNGNAGGIGGSGQIIVTEYYVSGSGSGVSSIAKEGSTALTGSVTLSEGSNVTLTQVGNDIEISSSGGGGGFSPEFYTSSIVNTSSSSITSDTFTTFSNSPAFTFTPTASGTFKVYSSACFLNQNGGSGYAQTRIVLTSGAGSSQTSESMGSAYCGGGVVQMSTFIQSVFTLVSGTEYVFDIQGRSIVASSGIILRGEATGGDAGSPFYMYAERVS